MIVTFYVLSMTLSLQKRGTSAMQHALFMGTLLAGLAAACLPAADEAPVRIKPAEARQHVAKKVEVVFEVKASKHSAKRKTTYLDSEADFNDQNNLGIAVSEQGIADLKQQRGVESPAEYYRGRKIRVVGTVVLEEDRPYIKVDAAEQLDLAKE
jgi:hypothetical protein